MNTPPLKFYYALIRMALPMAVLFLYLSHDAQGQYSGTGTFTKITSVAELTDGYYVITNETDAHVMTNGRSGSDTTGYSLSASISPAGGGVITNPSVNNVWKIETNGSGKSIYNEAIAKYVGWRSGNAASIEDAVDHNRVRWTFAYSSNKWTVNNVGTTARQLSYNSSAPRFAAYGNNGQHELQRYKFAAPTGPTHNIIFDANGGTGTMPNQAIAENGSANLNANTFTRSGYVFSGWSTNINGPVHYADGANFSMGTADVTLFAQWEEYVEPCFEEDFDSITAGNNTETNGSSSAWSGNTNFPTVEHAYQASGAVRIGTGSAIGSITSRSLDEISGDVTVNIDVKGWTTVEGSLNVTLDGVMENVTYSATMSSGFETVSVDFTNVFPGATLKIETSSKRAFIDNIEIICSSDPSIFVSPTSIMGLGYEEFSPTSPSQSFSLSAYNLDPATGSLSLDAPAFFELSTNDVNFSDNLILPYTEGVLEATNIYVRIKENMEVSNYFGNIAITGGGADAVNLPVEGEVWEYSDQCGFEDFNNSDLSSSYSDGSFVGNGGVTWTYAHARDQNVYEIDGNGIMLRTAELSYLEVVLQDGVGTFSFDYRKAFTGGSDRQLELIVNGVQVATTPVFGDVSGEDPTVHHFSYDVLVSEEVTIRIKNVGSDENNRQIILDNISWTCYSGCTPTHQITEFYPLSGPANTTVSIVGSGFTGATGVLFGTIPASSFVVVNDGLIEAKAPEEGVNDLIYVLDSDGCPRSTQEFFDFLTHNNNCGFSGGGGVPYATELFISEVYDAPSGSLSYVEVFNGTEDDINVSNYSIQIITGPIATFSMNGTLNSGDTYILKIGSGTICDGVEPNDDQDEAQGFNGDDVINLLKNSVVIDHVPNPCYGAGSKCPGFSQVRKATVTSPNAVYDENEWIITNQPNCDHLGIGPYMADGNNVIINTHPVDVYCDDLVLTVDATLIQGGTMGFTWRYNAPGEPDWSLVSSLNGNNGLTVTGSGTNTITISGAVSTLYGYQFYVDVKSGGTNECIRQSHVAKYSFDTEFYYQTKDNTDGNWSDVDNWEMSESESGPWTDACNYPLDATSGKIIIRSGHTVTFDVQLAVDHLVVEENATLILTPSNKLTINDGNPAGADLVINGTLVDNGNTFGGVDYGAMGSPTWILGSGATIIKTGTSSVARYRDNYESGIANISADGHWIYRRTIENNISLVAANMYYPNLYFENDVTGDYNPGLSLNMLTGNNPMVVKGDMNIGMAGAGNYVVTSTVSELIEIKGNLNIGAGSKFKNFQGQTSGSGLEVFGDVHVDYSGTLELSSTGELRMHGNLMMNGTITGGTHRFVGGNHQSVTTTQDVGFGGYSSLWVHNLILDKLSGNVYVDQVKFTINNGMEFNQGLLVLEQSNLLVEISIEAVVNNASNQSFVVGKVRKIAYTPETSFTFPIGDTTETGNAWYQPVRISAATSMNGTYDAQYFAHAHPEAGTFYDGQPYNNRDIGKCDHWVVTKGDMSADVQLAFKYTNEDDEYCNDVEVPADLDLASWNGMAWDDVPDDHSEITTGWIKTGIGGPTTLYGAFAFASTNNANVLPIELLEFSAWPDGGAVMTHWATATETNNDYFTVERSADGMDFHPVGTVKGAGHSSVRREYRFRDLQPLPGVSYYRLRQTDFDGGFSFGPVRAVKLDAQAGFGIEQVYRGEGGIELLYRSPAPIVEIEIFNVLGQRVFHMTEENRNGQSRITATLERGVYLLRLRDSNGNVESRKFFY